MPGGEAEFRNLFPDRANKIDTDGNVEDHVRAEFWSDVDAWDGAVGIEQHVSKCCARRQYRGGNVDLDANEILGSAQPIESIAVDFANQADPSSAVPPPTPADARLVLTQVIHEPDNDIALNQFMGEFSGLYLRAFTYGRNTRIFGFRNPDSREDPVPDGETLTLFERLAIPGADPVDYTMLAISPHGNARVRVPTVFDANMWNLDAFQPGGVTAPPTGAGLPEVITPPPQCRRVRKAPRKIS